MFLRGDIWRAVAINRLQAPTLLSLRDSRQAKTKASVQSTLPNIILRAFRCTGSINSSRYKGIAAETGESYSRMDLTILQQTNTGIVNAQSNSLEGPQHKQSLSSFFMNTVTMFVPREVIRDNNPKEFITRYPINDYTIKLNRCYNSGLVFQKIDNRIFTFFFSLSRMLGMEVQVLIFAAISERQLGAH